MRSVYTIVFLLVFAATSAYSQQEGFAGRPITNNLSMPTGNTLHAGEFSIGIGPVEYGISENVQLGTNLLLFLFQVYNADVKVSFVDTEREAFAAGLGVQYFNLNLLSGDNDVSLTSLSPYIVYTMPVGQKTRLHLGANYSYFEADVGVDEVEATASTSGTSVSAGVEHSLSQKTKFVGEAGYDIDFEGLRVGGGVMWGWEVFRLKLGLLYFSPKGIGGLVLPYVGLWWRFDG
ncbi:porin family protein [bacterium]|nr:porin family protein [bacterium]